MPDETKHDSSKPERLWRAKDVASYLCCSESYVYKAAERGELPHLTIGPMLRFLPDEIRQFALRDRIDRERRAATRIGRREAQ